jgi:transmembrane sensor
MKEKKQTPDTDLLACFLSGEATPEEAMAITAADGLEPEALKQFLQVWIGGSQSFVPPSPEEAWQAFSPLLKKASHTPAITVRWWMAAACLAVVIGLGALLLSPPSKKLAVLPGVSLHAGDNILERQLPDGSSVVLQKKSSVQYPSGFAVRDVQLKGESFFNVVPDKNRPFIISVGGIKIRVVGTSFNVKEAGDTAIIVQVHSGTVEMFSGQNKIKVQKGQSGIYKVAEGLFFLADGMDVNSTSYATKDFSFNNLPLSQVIVSLEEALGVKIILADVALRTCRLTSDFHQQSLDYILEILSTTVNGSFTKTGNTIYLYGKGCTN